MSHRDLRRRCTANRRAISNSRAPRPSQSPSPAARWKIQPSDGKKLWRPSENVKSLKRSKSDPLLRETGGREVDALGEEEEEAVLYRPQTCMDIFSSPGNSILRSPGKCSEGYNKDMKVVVNVTVEGSSGPIRTMVKLGSSVEETIKLVINKYNEEGRSPHLEKKAASTFELHHSYFSLQSLSKSDLIGDVGSRSFYLRKCSSRSDDSRTDKTSASSNELYIPRSPFVPSSIYRKIKKIIRRTQRIWSFLGCIPCAG